MMLPSLVRFYGTLAPNGQPWAQSPYGVAKVFLEAIPRLQAKDALVLTAAVAIGTGSMRKEDARQTIRAWQKDARLGERAEKAQKIAGHAAMKERLAAAGIAFVVVPKRKPTDG